MTNSRERPERERSNLPSPSQIARESGAPSVGDHQVWHLGGYPESRIAWLAGAFEPRFPDDYIHVANVQAKSLSDAAALTMHQGSMLDGTSKSWVQNPATQALVFAPRSTDSGDVIVDPAGTVFQMERDGFRTIEPAGQALVPGRDLADRSSPSELARQAAVEAGAALKAAIKGDVEEIAPERSGQLSPPHTPGRGRR